ncbi:hypothetical protein NLG97_g2811 [Lecanicillium saksenae]|uniref:Uncharacterized protein n=1 Tax=Lecanicillium saksenae TaxID=468837 RepID=A0ACC1R390_9HYPO|nr:hypothetical protein NLG97_g2811 [Lecanicillium saksenae]
MRELDLEHENEDHQVSFGKRFEARAMSPTTRSQGSASISKADIRTSSRFEIDDKPARRPSTRSSKQSKDESMATMQLWVQEYVEDRLVQDKAQRDQEVALLKEALSKTENKLKILTEKSTDDTIKNKWDTMGYNIRNIVHMMRSRQLRADDSTLSIFRGRVPVATFTNVPQESGEAHVAMFLGAYLWNFVYSDILCGRGRQWKNLVFRHIQAAKREMMVMEDKLESKSRLASWFAQSTAKDVCQIDETGQQDLIDHILAALFKLSHNDSSELEEKQLRELIAVVVHDATELATIVMSSQALLLPDWPITRQRGRNWTWKSFDMENFTLDGSTSRPALVYF